MISCTHNSNNIYNNAVFRNFYLFFKIPVQKLRWRSASATDYSYFYTNIWATRQLVNHQTNNWHTAVSMCWGTLSCSCTLRGSRHSSSCERIMQQQMPEARSVFTFSFHRELWPFMISHSYDSIGLIVRRRFDSLSDVHTSACPSASTVSAVRFF